MVIHRFKSKLYKDRMISSRQGLGNSRMFHDASSMFHEINAMNWDQSSKAATPSISLSSFSSQFDPLVMWVLPVPKRSFHLRFFTFLVGAPSGEIFEGDATSWGNGGPSGTVLPDWWLRFVFWTTLGILGRIGWLDEVTGVAQRRLSAFGLLYDQKSGHTVWG